jgi:hypothetical protein
LRWIKHAQIRRSLTWIKTIAAGPAQERRQHDFEERAMSGEALYLGLVIAAFLTFAATVAYVSFLERRR